jgi:hypothetical protein
MGSGRTDGERAADAHGAPFRGVLWGGILLVAGTWFLLQRLGIQLPNIFAALWPVVPVLFGLGFLVSFFTGECKDPGQVWPGTFGVLLGSFFFLFSFGVFPWERMSELWPMFPLMVGISFVATWLAGRCKEIGLLVPATITLSVGIIGLGFTLDVLDARTVDALWPLALVVLGALLIVRSLRRQRPREAGLSVESSRRDE